MTHEDYIRSVLLGGMRPAGFFSRVRGSSIPLAESDQEASFLPKLESLQQATLEKSSIHDVTRRTAFTELTSGRVSRSPEGTIRRAFERSELLDQASQGAQWQALRADILSRLEELYVFRDHVRVRSFLEQHSFLVPLLLKASLKLGEYFEVSAKTILDVVVDPDDARYQELWVRIQTKLAPAIALTKLTRFDEEWWLDASVSAQCLMNVNLEFV